MLHLVSPVYCNVFFFILWTACFEELISRLFCLLGDREMKLYVLNCFQKLHKLLPNLLKNRLIFFQFSEHQHGELIRSKVSII